MNIAALTGLEIMQAFAAGKLPRPPISTTMPMDLEKLSIAVAILQRLGVQHSATSRYRCVCSWVMAQPAQRTDSVSALTTISRIWPARLRKVLETA